MSPRNLHRFWLASTVAAIAWVGGCDDDNGPSPMEEMDAGDHDAGNPDPEPDSGMSEDDGGTSTCETACPDNMLATVRMRGCCIEETGACGLEVGSLQQIDPSFTLTGCYERDRDGEQSDHCGGFFDQLDQMVNGRFDLTLESGSLPFAGCCTPEGECGVMLSETSITANGETRNYNLHLGCVGFRELQEALGTSGDAGISDPLKLDVLPFCNPANGEAPTEGTVPGVPAFVCGCGEDTPYTDQAVPCLSRLPATVCGADAPKAEELAQFPAFACGCGAGEAWQPGQLLCINNVAKETCGTGPIDEALEQVPEYVCGCGETVIGEGSCLNKTAPTTCGELPFEGDAVPGVHEYACGCGDDAVASGCIPNVPQDVCGAVEFTEGDVPGVPEYACGCGDEMLGDGRCIPNIPQNLCGAMEFTEGDVPGVPEYACGCGDEVLGDGKCIPNIPQNLCGAMEFTEGDVPGVPEYACGCGDEVLGDGKCIPNIPQNLCGEIPVTQGPIPDYPETVCGCGDGQIRAAGLPCFNNVPNTVCGADAAPIHPVNQCVVSYPGNVSGCGEDTPASYPATCISNVPESMSGCGT